MEKSVLIASGNNHKIKEIHNIAPEFPFIAPQDIGINIAPDEHGNSFLENALLKARAFYHASYPQLTNNCIVLADDSGICIDSLHGSPGIHSARYKQKEFDNSPRTCSLDHFQCLSILKEMQNFKNRSAHFICCAVLMWGEHEYTIYQAKWEGEIITSQLMGNNGFGYDPIFYIPEKQCTSAQLSQEEKNNISHRAHAIQGLKPSITHLLKKASH